MSVVYIFGITEMKLVQNITVEHSKPGYTEACEGRYKTSPRSPQGQSYRY